MKKIRVENLVIGKTFSTLLYAFRTNSHCILHEAQRPFEFCSNFDLYDFSMFGDVTPISLWDRMCFVMNASGLLLFPDNIQSLRHEGGQVEIINKRNRNFIVECDKVQHFDTNKSKIIDVYDYFWCRVGGAHDRDYIQDTENDFVNKIIFYPRPTKPNIRDLIAVSQCPETSLDDLEVSSVYSRLKSLSMMSDAGLKGKISGYRDNGNPIIHRTKIEWEKRIVLNRFESPMTFDEIYNLTQEESYAWKLLRSIIPITSTSLA